MLPKIFRKRPNALDIKTQSQIDLTWGVIIDKFGQTEPNFMVLSELKALIGGGTNVVVEVTYSELSVLILNSGLTTGGKYIITDYVTKYQQPVTNSILQGTAEPIIVEASGVNCLKPIAFSSLFPDDIIYYDFDDNLCEDLTTARPGVITRRIDTKNNIDVSFDWRNVKFRRYKEDMTTWTAGSYVVGNIVKYLSKGYICIKNTSETPSTSATDWVCFIELSATTYWGYDSGTLYDVPFSATDPIDVYLFADLDDLTNSSGIGGCGYGYHDVKISTTWSLSARFAGIETFSKYGNNVFYYPGDDDSICFTLGRIDISNGDQYDEGQHIVQKNTFYGGNRIKIYGDLNNTVVSGIFYEFIKETGHNSSTGNYFHSLVQSSMSGNSALDGNKIYNFANNDFFAGYVGELVCKNIQTCSFICFSSFTSSFATDIYKILFKGAITGLTRSMSSALLSILADIDCSKEAISRLDGTGKISYYNNSDSLEILSIS